jgi:hypothetical protein
VAQYWRIKNQGKPETEFGKCHTNLPGWQQKWVSNYPKKFEK